MPEVSLKHCHELTVGEIVFLDEFADKKVDRLHPFPLSDNSGVKNHQFSVIFFIYGKSLTHLKFQMYYFIVYLFLNVLYAPLEFFLGDSINRRVETVDRIVCSIKRSFFHALTFSFPSAILLVKVRSFEVTEFFSEDPPILRFRYFSPFS